MKTVPEIIKAIEIHKNLRPCEHCPYDAPRRGRCLDRLLEDVLEVLKSMEDDLK